MAPTETDDALPALLRNDLFGKANTRRGHFGNLIGTNVFNALIQRHFYQTLHPDTDALVGGSHVCKCLDPTDVDGKVTRSLSSDKTQVQKRAKTYGLLDKSGCSVDTSHFTPEGFATYLMNSNYLILVDHLACRDHEYSP
jgi:hypothetical protein